MSHPRDPAQLPIPDYDAQPIAAVVSQVQTLDEGQLTAVLEYERQHANRVGVLTAGETRLHQLRTGTAASPGASQ